jgi:hypothetical protein
MPSPFPGMDPYLEEEKLWPVFQHQLVMCLYQILLPGLVDRYQARVEQRCYVTEQPRSTSVVRQEHQEEHIEIRERSDGKFVTLLDVVSPTNKTTDTGRRAYLAKRSEARDEGANLVEIDLVLQGKPTLEYSRDGLPEWDYAVTVTRATQSERHEIYSATLQKRLPRFRLPLAADDHDTVLDLNAAFARCYDQGGFAQRIDYRREPLVPLNEENRRWVRELLHWHFHIREGSPAGLRGCTLPHEAIAIAAYYLWQKEGCAHGKDKDHWQRAIEQLQRERGQS